MDTNVAQDQMGAYKKALEMEQATIDFYTQKANEVKAPSQKEVLLNIASEEKKHYFLLENLIEFMAKPAQWVEHAEFNHLDEYYE